MMKKAFSILIILLFAITAQSEAQKLTERKVRKMFMESEIMQEHFVGFILQEETGKIVYAQHQDIHFVPASNTKLLTLYTALNILGDSIPAFKYRIEGDSLIIWGTGDPSFLHPKLDNRRTYDFLANTPHQIFMANEPDLEFEPSYWRSDLSYFPMYGNLATIKSDTTLGLFVFPEPISRYVVQDSTIISTRFNINRSKSGKELVYPKMTIPGDFQSTVPFPMDLQVTRILLEDTLKKEVNLIMKKKPSETNIYFSIPSDSLYRHMMLPSDNFIAEQILLMCSGMISDTLNVKTTIEFGLENHYKEFKNPPVWEDGSGLSRFNLFTPSTVLEVLNLIEKKIGDKGRLKSLLPEGGVSGTLRTAYQTDNGKPFVWAKTGSLKYMHLQSGWLETRKGRGYRYVFMNNNFVRPNSEVRNEMVRIMTEIHERY
ncbi:D-alanyl-D-alanine carboxypeptidase [Aquiflexum sp.]|uniref:D-alanyl-D-alanine carboxypeptidase n=1 Tax=Aquiflexum sp. TaxID=1872584 RepID=UPI0035940B5D